MNDSRDIYLQCMPCLCLSDGRQAVYLAAGCLPIPDGTLIRNSVADGHIDNQKLIYPLADAGKLLGLGFLPTIRINHSDSTREAKWDNRVFVEACKVHSKVR